MCAADGSDLAELTTSHPWGVICVHAEGTQIVLRLVGEIDYAVVADFELNHRPSVLVDSIDASQVTFISAAGITLMLSLLKASRAKNHCLVLRRSSLVVDRVLGLVGLDKTFPRAARDC